MSKDELYEKIIREVSKIVKEEIEKFNNHSEDIEYLDSIPYELRKEVQEEAEIHLFEMMNEENPLLDIILQRDTDIIYEPELVINLICEKYGERYRLFFKVHNKNHNIKCIAYLPSNGVIRKDIETDLDKLGYFIGTSEYLTDSSGFNWIAYHFEPYNQKNESSEIKKYRYIYHITPYSNLKYIMQNGLLKRSSSNYNPHHFAYPERLYLVDGSRSETEMYKVANMMYASKCEDKPDAECRYAILKLDNLKIPKDIEMFYDPNYKYGIFVTENLPASCIADVKIYDCKKKKYIRDSFLLKFRYALYNLFK